MKKRLLIIIVAALAIVGCRKEPDPDLYEAFKADATPRWERGMTKEINESSPYTFITDEGGTLFSSGKYKIGRITAADGSSYEIIEFSGSPAVGKPSDPTIRKHSGSVPLHNLEILKMENGKLWVVFQETETSSERLVVHLIAN